MSRRELEIEAGRKHLAAADKWTATLHAMPPMFELGPIETSPVGVTFRASINTELEALQNECIREAVRHQVHAAILLTMSPYREAQRVRRRVRMARKRRRGYA